MKHIVQILVKMVHGEVESAPEFVKIVHFKGCWSH